METIRGGIGMQEPLRTRFTVQGRTVKRAVIRIEGNVVKRDVAFLEFDEHGRKVSTQIVNAHLAAAVAEAIRQHEDAGWPDVALDRDMLLAGYVRELCGQIRDSASAVHFADNPVQLPWTTKGSLTVRCE